MAMRNDREATLTASGTLSHRKERAGWAGSSWPGGAGAGDLISLAAPGAADGKIELLRDTWGIPHMFSDTDAGAMYGLGYVTAQERGFK
jgi:acyl-homoserine lactone acylase PvdQ